VTFGTYEERLPATPVFQPFSKIPRLSRDIIITEKLDGTNAQVFISEEGIIYAGSRNRWLTLENDNYGFARWVEENKTSLLALGPGRHYGEWWGQGIQRGYGLKERRFSLFNVGRWGPGSARPACCESVPILYEGWFSMHPVFRALEKLEESGSVAAPGFMKPEGIVIYHTAGNYLFKKTLENDDKPKGASSEST
jgi:hypothetical protein